MGGFLGWGDGVGCGAVLLLGVAIGALWGVLSTRRSLGVIEGALVGKARRSIRSRRVDAIVGGVEHLKVRAEFLGAGEQRSVRSPDHSTPIPQRREDLWRRAGASLGGIRGVKSGAIVVAEPGAPVEIYGSLGSCPRFRGVVERLYGGYLRSGEPQPAGVRDGALSRAVFGDFVDLGFRYALVHPVVFPLGERTGRAIVWLGFGAERPPTEGTMTVVRGVAATLEEDLRVFAAVALIAERAESAEHVSARKSEFLAQVSHDIRSPLNNIRAVLALLRCERDDDRAREMIDIAVRNCDGVGELVEDVLDFARYKEGRLQTRREVVKPADVVAEVVESFALAAREKTLTIDCRCGASARALFIDRRHLRRIVTNLLGNAIKYTPRGWVRIELEEGAGATVLTVTDSGVGMSAEEVAGLFTPFTRFGDDRIEGVGLGLSVTRALIEANGGCIGVTATPHVGSTFTVTFPHDAPTVSRGTGEVAEINSDTLVGGRARPPTILLVDDDPDSCRSLARALARFPVETLVATSVPDGISIFNFASPDIVVTDLGMPLGGGERILEHIRSSGRGTPTYCLTGDPEGARLAARGAAGVFQKPVDIGALWCAIESGVGTAGR